MRKPSILKGALILTAAGVITRVLGFIYRIYMSNVIGAEGMGLYQLIMPVYGLAWAIACSGFTTTLSKLVAQERAKAEYGNMGRLLKQSVLITGSIGLILSALLYGGAGYISEFIIKDARTLLPLRIVAAAFPFMAAGSCFRGYFFGLQETLVPAINQVLEQCVRMTVVFFLASTFVPMGLEYACAAAVIGIVAEEIFSLVYILLSYRRFKMKNTLIKRPSMSPWVSLGLLISMALPLTANRVTGSLLSAVENILIPQRLQLYGLSAAEAMSTFGRISGMAMPIIYFPSAFLISLGISLVPAVSAASATKNYSRIHYAASRSILFAAIVGFGASGLFVVFAKELGFIIYNQDISEMLFLLGLMCPFLYMQVVLSGILNGLGFQVFLFRNSLISSVITIGFVYFLIPKYGINAFIFGWFVSLIVICAIELEKLRSEVALEFEFTKWFLKPLIAAAASGLSAKYLAANFILPLLGPGIGLITAAAILGLAYMFFIVALGCLSISEIKDILKSIRPKNNTGTKPGY